MINPSCQHGLKPAYAMSIGGFEDDACDLPVAKPIRVFQFLIVGILFGVTVWSVSKQPAPFDNVAAILLTVLFGSFLFIALIDIISQFGGDPIPDTPMFLFGVVGTLFFLVAAGGVFFLWSRRSSWELLLIICLSGSSAILYLLDVLLIFLYGY